MPPDNDPHRGDRPSGSHPARRDVDEEIRFHLDMMTDFFVKRGMSQNKARHAAEQRFGDIDRYRRNLTRAKDRSRRKIGIASVLASLREDLGFALRYASRSYGFTIGVALTIALGVGANATMYGVIDRILLTPPPHIQRPHEVKRMYVEGLFFGRTETHSYVSYPDVRDWDAAGSFESTAAFAVREVTLGYGEDAERVMGVFATASLFPLLGVVPHQGRVFTQEDDVRGAAPVAVLGYEFWRRRFGQSETAIGQMLDLGPTRYTIVGVAPRGFTGVDLARVDVWLPLHSDEEVDEWNDDRGYHWIQSVVRLRTGIEPEAAASEATVLHRAGRATDSDYDPQARVRVEPIMAASGPDASGESTVARWLMGVSLIVLVIACANVANLLLANGERRRREIALRLALGISRARLVRQLLAGSVLLGLLGAGGALAVTKVAGDLIGSVLLPNIDWSLGLVSGGVMVFTLVVAVVTGIAAGLIPAWQSSHSDLVTALKNGGTWGATRRSRTRAAFQIAQTALSVVLLVGAGLFVQSLSRVSSADLGIETEGLYLATLETEPGVDNRDHRVMIYQNALDRLQSLPVVRAASAIRSVPFRGSIAVSLRAQGLDSIPRLPSAGPYINAVTPDYFDAAGVDILRGRALSDSDSEGAARVAVVGETMARHLWPEGVALGKCLYIGRADPPCTEIVGIAEDARNFGVIEDDQLMYYVPSAQQRDLWNPRGLLIRTPTATPEVQAALKRELYAAEPSLRFVTVVRFAELVTPQLRSWRLGATVFTAFGVLALVVAAVGLYSVLSFEIAQRRPEIGLRAALGADASRLIRWVVTGGVRFVAIGIALGGVVAFFASPAIGPLLYETSPRDPLTYGIVTATLLGVALVASLLPALRSARVEPSEALRAE